MNQLDHVIDPVGQSLARLNFENPKICQIMIIFTWDMFDHVMFSLVFRLIWNFTRKESKIMKISLSENGLGLARNNNFEFTFRKKYRNKLLFRTRWDIYTDAFNMQFISSNKINFIIRLRNNVTIETIFES